LPSSEENAVESVRLSTIDNALFEQRVLLLLFHKGIIRSDLSLFMCIFLCVPTLRESKTLLDVLRLCSIITQAARGDFYHRLSRSVCAPLESAASAPVTFLTQTPRWEQNFLAEKTMGPAAAVINSPLSCFDYRRHQQAGKIPGIWKSTKK
jgi:hypothetical protein